MKFLLALIASSLLAIAAMTFLALSVNEPPRSLDAQSAMSGERNSQHQTDGDGVINRSVSRMPTELSLGLDPLTDSRRSKLMSLDLPVIRGRARFANGAPAGGATISAFPSFLGGQNPDPSKPLQQTTSDSAGMFEISGTCNSPLSLIGRWNDLMGSVHACSSGQFVELELAESSSGVLRVITEFGQGIEGASVRGIWHERQLVMHLGKSDEFGWLTTNMIPYGDVVIVADHREYRTFRSSPIPTSSLNNMVIELQSASAVEGQVTDEGGSSIPGVVVKDYANRHKMVETDSNGRYRIPGYNGDDTPTIIFTKPGYDQVALRVMPYMLSGSVISLDAKLSACDGFTVCVSNDAGPVSGAQVSVTCYFNTAQFRGVDAVSRAQLVESGYTNGAGRFLVSTIPTQLECFLGVDDRKHGSAYRVLSEQDKVAGEVDIKLHPPSSLTVVATCAGQPISELISVKSRVTLERTNRKSNEPVSISTMEGYLNRDGRMLFTHLESGEYSVYVDIVSGMSISDRVSVEGDEILNLVFPEGELRIQVLDSNRNIATNAFVRIKRKSGEDKWITGMMVDETGHGIFRGLESVEYLIHARLANDPRCEQTRTVVTGVGTYEVVLPYHSNQ